MQCPFCQNVITSVKDSRSIKDGSVIRRRRQCDNCSARFSTYEEAHIQDVYVIKRSGVHKPFDKEKILKSVTTAVRKRHVTDQQIAIIVDNICKELMTSQTPYIPTRQIGNMILTALAKVDEVSYIRFASVYKDFVSAKDFSIFIDNFLKQQKTTKKI